MNDIKERKYKIRFMLLYVVIAMCALAIVYRLMDLQIVQREVYAEKAVSKTTSVNFSIIPPRGGLYDRYGRPLNTNKIGNKVSFVQELIGEKELNGVILEMTRLFDAQSAKYNDSFPITTTEPFAFTYADSAESSANTRIIKFMQQHKLEEDSSVSDVIDYFAEKYEVDAELLPMEKRAIIGVRYEMEQNYFGKGQPFVFANDVDMAVITNIREQGKLFKGISIETVPSRVYNQTTLASHIIGHVGSAYKEDVERLGESYRIGDIIGRSGMEYAMEDTLRGTVGEITRIYNADGTPAETIQNKAWEPGNNVVLTIDSYLQERLNKSIENIIPKIRTMKDGEQADAGAAVLLDVNTFEVLAMTSYPSYDISLYNKNFGEMINDPLKPMFNRALQGEYPPGSVFKPLTAAAALSEGTVDSSFTVNDTGVYRFYADAGYEPVCWIYGDYRRGHGVVNVIGAVEHSCNYYFYDVGRQLGIDKLSQYAARFGLGSRTGIELSGESKGLLAGKESREAMGKKWYPGDTIQAAIGQSDHLYTPLQLACYISTLANGGTRYNAHLVKGVIKSDYSSPMQETIPVVQDAIVIKQQDIENIKEGMYRASKTGTASAILSKFPYPVASKTGTASVSEGAANAVFVAFTPVDKPEVAIAIVVEHGGHGSYAAEVARDMFDAYYNRKATDELQPFDTILK